MALNYTSSTLSLTLPISCQICLGKVKQPVICANYHVFCSSCMEMWLTNASKCPTCRVPITPENPCRKVIGGTNESDHSDSASVRKCLRKTRGDLLFQEYENEIEGLVRENEDLKTKNQSLEAQLKTALDPCSIEKVQSADKNVDPYILEEWTNKLRAATDVCDKVKHDMDKLKEANKVLRSQNIDLVQENMRLKAEVASRSPQKFGRYTVAALEAKIQQYERDVDHLNRALERSDQYIEDLKSKVRKSEKGCLEMQEACGSSKAGSEALTQQQKINMMMRSLSDNERQLICSNPEAEAQTFSRNQGLMFMPSADHKGYSKNVSSDQKTEDFENASDFLPTTPSSAFRSLTLRSPGIREKKVAFKPAYYLRRLDFEGFPSPGKNSSTVENQFGGHDKFPKGFPPSTDEEPSKSDSWGGWQRSNSNDMQACPGPSKGSSVKESTSTFPVGGESDSFQVSSEASMDAAYLDKISELDSMMLDGESSSSRGSQLSLVSSPHTNLDNTLIPEPETCPDLKSSHSGKHAVQYDQMNHSLRNNRDDTLDGQEAPGGSAEEGFTALVSLRERSADVSECAVYEGPSRTEGLSFDLLFGPQQEKKAVLSGSLHPAGQDHDPVSFSSSTTKPVNTTRERHALNIGQPTKRKSHSPFNISSPTKLSKLM